MSISEYHTLLFISRLLEEHTTMAVATMITCVKETIPTLLPNVWLDTQHESCHGLPVTCFTYITGSWEEPRVR